MPEPGAREEQLFTLKPLHVLLVGAGVLSSGESRACCQKAAAPHAAPY